MLQLYLCFDVKYFFPEHLHQLIVSLEAWHSFCVKFLPTVIHEIRDDDMYIIMWTNILDILFHKTTGVFNFLIYFDEFFSV